MYQREGKSAFKKDLNNTIALCEALGNPEKKFKSIHLAGTNGKGSCAHMLASIFQEAGYKTGLYTSPHLKDYRERIKVNGKLIPETEVMEFVNSYDDTFSKIKPSFFEWTVALAFHHFAKEGVDIAIIETGLGGRLDSTNVIDPEMSMITNIGWDHMDMLGDTLEKIAKEKAGIIKKHKPVVIGNTSNVKSVFEEKAEQCNSKVYFAEEYRIPDDLKTELRGKYQSENLRTVFTTWLCIRRTDEIVYQISYPQLQKGLLKVIENTGLRGRWETLSEDPKVIADVAHNEDGLKWVMQQLKEEEFEKLHIVLGLVKDKAVEKILSYFPNSAQYYFCEAKVPRALSVNVLEQAAKQAGLEGKSYVSVASAIAAAKGNAAKNDLIYIGGSNFVVAEAI
ncbi:MAG: tetrahydrofolate synthase [Flavobacteriales bacterium]|nr:tetrahydrofolate synthase [Flavobacteriales bacterium]|tara:strand:+ start:668 stop:1849 length:1182 start_codon:yes stop_codon:yes gene_type:complete